MYRATAQWPLAITQLQLALKIEPISQPTKAGLEYQLGRVYTKQGKLTLAAQWLSSSISISQNVFGALHIDCYRPLLRLAKVYSEMGGSPPCRAAPHECLCR